MLTGGNVAGQVVRVGDTVRKPVTSATPAVEALLRHLEAAGFAGAPRTLGRDERGRQVLEYIPFTNRFTHTADFVPSPAEEQLYQEVSEYLQREVLVALPNARRKLITLIMRKLLASSSAAIGATLTKFVERLSGQAQVALPVTPR